MNSNRNTLVMVEICNQIKQRGYAPSKVVRIYGEDFDILSDPFPEDEGVAIRVRSRQTLQTRVLQLPAALVQKPRRAA